MPNMSTESRGGDWRGRKFTRSVRFARRLRRFRVARNLTQTEAAKRLGVSRLTWVSWESGTRFPASEKTLDSIAELLGTTAAELLRDDA